MKNFLLRFFLTSLVVGVGMFASSNAQYMCVPGYIGGMFDITDSRGCTWRIHCCYTCGITGADPVNMKLTGIDPIPPNNCSEPDRDEIIALLMQQWTDLCSIGDCDLENDPGCTSHGRMWSITYPVCWQWHITGTISNGVYSFRKWLSSCNGDGYCMITTAFCRNPATNQLEKCPNASYYYNLVDLNCTTTPILESEIPEPAHNPMNLGDHTYGNCFQLVGCP